VWGMQIKINVRGCYLGHCVANWSSLRAQARSCTVTVSCKSFSHVSCVGQQNNIRQTHF